MFVSKESILHKGHLIQKAMKTAGFAAKLRASGTVSLWGDNGL